MVLPNTEFQPQLQKRIINYPVVAHRNISESDDPFVKQIAKFDPKPGVPQAIPVPGSERPGFSAVYRNAEQPEQLVTVIHPHIQTADDLFRCIAHKHPNSLCLGERIFDQVTKEWGPFLFQTYSEIDERVSNVASGILNIVEKHTGLDPFKEQYTVGLYGPNSKNWVLTDFACNRTALTPVPLYDTLGADAVKYIINLTEMPVIFASIAHIPYLLSTKHLLPSLKLIISLNELSDPEYYEHPGHSKRDVLGAWATSVGVDLYSFSDIEDSGKHVPHKHRKPTRDDIFTLNFTSGTTGNPKGVIIRHSNLVASAVLTRANDIISDVVGEDTFLSFLPLAHIYERINIHSMVGAGIKIGFFRGDATKIFEDIKELEPSIICGVPRIWNKMVNSIRATTVEAPGEIGKLSRKAFEAKLKNLKQNRELKHPKYDKLWSDNIRQVLGFSKAKVIHSGSAPLAAENIDFIKCSLGVYFAEGYGLTESTSGITFMNPKDQHSGAVGPPLVTGEVCLRDLKELGYSIEDKPYPRGEIMLRGPQLFQGYYKNPEETAKALTEDGWFHTGDVGQIDDEGRLYVIDRVKNMFKLAQGEYVATERLEALYSSASSLISQIFIDGNSFETYLVAIIGVTPEKFSEFVGKKFGTKISPTDKSQIEQMFKRPDIRKAFLEAINKDVKPAKLKGFELIKNLQLFFDPLSPENGTLTPTLKIKRPDCRRYFNAVTSEMYNEGMLLDNGKI